MLCSSTSVLNSIKITWAIHIYATEILQEDFSIVCQSHEVLIVCTGFFACMHAYTCKLSYFSIVWPIWFGWTDSSRWLKNNWWHVNIIIIMLWYYVTHQLLLKLMWSPLVCTGVVFLSSCINDLCFVITIISPQCWYFNLQYFTHTPRLLVCTGNGVILYVKHRNTNNFNSNLLIFIYIVWCVCVCVCVWSIRRYFVTQFSVPHCS